MEPPPPARVAPLFRRIDWLALGITLAIVWTIYFITLAPQVTLEDSGELCTASYYAGIPHPPGYPFWTIYTWLWTVLVPFKNIAWRVALAEATTAAAACAVVAFLVSRGSSMLMDSIDELKQKTGRWENPICLVSGLTAGLMLALGSSMWKESVVINRISLFGVPWLIMVLLCLLRWNYAPHQRRYLYLAMFFFGICATIHQTLTLAAMGIEIGIAARQPKLGRDLFAGNSILFLIGVIAKQYHMVSFFDATNPMVYNIFLGIGLLSIGACVYLSISTGGLLSEWKAAVLMGVLWFAGASFYFYEAVSGMTNPPMEWGYPRTVEGFWHALSRGQYDKINPTDIFHDPGHVAVELWMLFTGVADAFSWVVMFVGLLPLFFLWRMQKRERAWIITVAATYPFLGVLLSIFLNPTRERQTADLVKVFFTASHSIVAILIGYGFALIAAFMATNYQKFRRWGLIGGGVAVALAFYSLYDSTKQHFFGLDENIHLSLGEWPHWVAQAFAPHVYGWPVFGGLLLVALTLIFLAAMVVCRERAPLGLTLALFVILPVYSGLSHWFHSEQHDHWFGYWFGHDMFTPPFVAPDGNLTYDASLRAAAAQGPHGQMVYPEMARDAVLFGGTDPGRFCPTYTIFCESFIPHHCQPEQDQHYDRRDVYIITQNALADNTYLDYIRAQYNRSAQIDPPFFQNFLSGTLPNLFAPGGSLAFVNSAYKPFGRLLDDVFENIGAKVERRRRTSTSWFHPDQFTRVENMAARLRPGPRQDALSAYLMGKLSEETRQLITSNGDSHKLSRALSADLNSIIASENLYTSNRFADIQLPPLILDAAATGTTLTTNNIVRLNRRLLEEAYPDAIVKSLGGVYPDTEILTPTPDDSTRCFDEYLEDAQRRLQHDSEHPNEPRQIKPGEDVRVDEQGRVQVSGQVAVMAINGLLTKVIFDNNPSHEFYVEESFALDWMYPYLTPFGVIMKINRHPVTELTQDVIDKDHAFWSEYSRRTIGNWITYDTSVKQICDWAEDVYLRHDFTHFTGDRRFIRDDDAQKAFSKLRGSIATSIYQWRARPQNSHSVEERTRVTKEAEFALKQSFAYCPYSPEAVFHFIELLLNESRINDALLILRTCHSLDPYNEQISQWIDQLSHTSENPAEIIQQAFATVNHDIAVNETDAAIQVLDQVMSDQGSNPMALMSAAQAYARLNDMAKSEDAVLKLTRVMPTSSEPWYNLAVIEAHRDEIPQAIESLKKSLQLNEDERKTHPQMVNLRQHLFDDATFAELRLRPEFRSAFGTKP